MSVRKTHTPAAGQRPPVKGDADPRSDIYDPKAPKLSRISLLWRHMRRLARDGHLPVWRQLWEIARLRRLSGCTVAHYFECRLYRRELSWDDKRKFVGPLRYTHLLVAVTPQRYRYIVRNKLVTHSLFVAFGLPTPKLYGVVERETDNNVSDHPLFLRSPADLLARLREEKTDTVCFKLIDGTRGIGFYRLTIDSNHGVATARIEPDSEEMPLDEFWRTRLRPPTRFLGYFCQEVIKPHPFFAGLNPWSLNTFRTWMVKDDRGGWEMAVAVLRMAIGESVIDNVSQGGLAARVDIASGRLSAAFPTGMDRTSYARHPLTGTPIEGETVPMWGEIRTLCERTAKRFPFFDLLAVDIAVGTGGPLVMELSVTPDDTQMVSDLPVGPLLESLAQRTRARERARAGSSSKNP